MRIGDVTTLTIEGAVAVIRTDSPPVNALAAPVRAGLAEALRVAVADPAVGAEADPCITWPEAATPPPVNAGK